MGTGLVVARREDGSWSPPSAIGLSSFGWGIQAGGELTDLLLVLSSPETVKVHCSRLAQILIQSEQHTIQLQCSDELLQFMF